jgi:hypothetical protein
MVASYVSSPSSGVAYPPDNFAEATLRVVDHDIAHEVTRPEEPARRSAPLTSTLTLELDGAQLVLGLGADEILLAALGRTIARTIGEGLVTVDVAGKGRASAAVPLSCAAVHHASATEMLAAVHFTFGAVPRHLHAVLPSGPSEILFNYVGAVSEPPLQSRSGYALELRAYRTAGLLHLDWWYDTRQFDPYTVEELAEQLPLSLVEMTSEAIPPV